MEYGNVLVIGNSGVGKSTLINAVLGKDSAKTGSGMDGITSRLEIYRNEDINFCIIDSVGFGPGFFKRKKAIDAIKKWSKDSAKESNEDRTINVIWYCIEGTSRKLFQESIDCLSKATSFWKSVPIIDVITKSYSELDCKENEEMVNNAFARQKRSINLKEVIPVVAAPFKITNDNIVAPKGIDKLIEATNKLMPEGKRVSKKAVKRFILNRKRFLAQGIVGATTGAGVTIGAVPIPFADALALQGLELGMINGIASVYEIKRDDATKDIIQQMVSVGTVSVAAKTAISALKAIPGINLAASVLNAVIAGSFIVAIGEGTIYIFEQVYLGKKSVEDIDWITKVLESEISGKLVDKVGKIIQGIANEKDYKKIGKMILEAFQDNKSVSKKRAKQIK